MLKLQKPEYMNGNCDRRQSLWNKPTSLTTRYMLNIPYCRSFTFRRPLPSCYSNMGALWCFWNVLSFHFHGIWTEHFVAQPKMYWSKRTATCREKKKLENPIILSCKLTTLADRWIFFIFHNVDKSRLEKTFLAFSMSIIKNLLEQQKKWSYIRR